MHTSTGVLAAVAVAAVLSQPSVRAQTGPNLVIAMHHTGNFTVGVNGVYTIVVSNTGGTASSGQISVDDELNPSGAYDFDLRSETGTGWSCSVDHHMPPNNHVSTSCVTTSVIAPGGLAPSITLTVIPIVSGTFINVADVGGGGGMGSSASDPIIVLAGVPTLPPWALIALTVCLALAAVVAMRRRTPQADAGEGQQKRGLNAACDPSRGAYPWRRP
jgi:uncharacterized repeat protein (TIGR01451 family)